MLTQADTADGSAYLTSTWGWHEQVMHTDGTTTCTNFTPTGLGVVTPSADTASAGCGTSSSPVVFALTDKTNFLPPRGNITTRRTATRLTSRPTGPTIWPRRPPTQRPQRSVHEQRRRHQQHRRRVRDRRPASTGTTTPADGRCQASGQVSCTLYEYDTYGQKIAMATPKSVAEAGTASSIPSTATCTTPTVTGTCPTRSPRAVAQGRHRPHRRRHPWRTDNTGQHDRHQRALRRPCL